MKCWKSFLRSISGSPLFSNDDTFHIHKTLGVFTLISYALRFRLGFHQDMGFASHPEWTILTICLHLALNLSSFEFRIPNRRIKTDGGRIWPEFRLHSLVFLSRSLAAIAINWYDTMSLPSSDDVNSNIENKDYNYRWNLWIVLGAMAAADLSSYSVGRGHSRSIRDLSAPSVVKYFFSIMQFFATAAVLLGLRRSSLYFAQCFVIQVTAFLLTLRRKRMVSHATNVILYGCLLGFAVVIGLAELGMYFCKADPPETNSYLVNRCDSDPTNLAILTILACSAALWRMGPWSIRKTPISNFFTNKYLIWTILYIVLQQVLRPIVLGETNTMTMNGWNISRVQLLQLAVVELGIVFLYGWNKQIQTET